MGQFADLVVMGASLEPMTEGKREDPGRGADAIAVAGGRIVAVGRRRDVRELVGPGTELLELEGNTVLPGFQDAHIHPIHGGLLRGRCDLHDLPDAAAYPPAVAAYARAHPERAWILGSGWAMPAFPGGNPGRDALDAVVPDRPVFLESRDGHSAWVNSRALSLLGIGRETPDPADGRIERDERGDPSGTLHEGAVALGRELVPPPTPAELAGALDEAQRYLHSLGITAWQDAGVAPPELATYRAAAAAGRLSVRVVASQLWDSSRGLEQVPDLVAARDASASVRLRASTVKFFVDGIIENGTALMSEPYLDARGEPTANRGMPMVDPDLLRAAVLELDRLGFQCHFHAIGDGASALALDAVAEAHAANGAGDRRHHIAHLEVVHPEQIGRFAALDVTANIQPIWATLDSQMLTLRLPVLGPRRAAWQYPFRSLQRAGARLAGGSDWTVSTPNPLLEVEAAITRIDADDRAMEPFLPAERLDLDTALRAYTIGSAFVNHLDAETGTLQVGNLADLVILDRDLRAGGAPIGEARVLRTFVEGREVYRA
jgi:predicted amidohydrolase YtcJ